MQVQIPQPIVRGRAEFIVKRPHSDLHQIFAATAGILICQLGLDTAQERFFGLIFAQPAGPIAKGYHTHAVNLAIVGGIADRDLPQCAGRGIAQAVLLHRVGIAMLHADCARILQLRIKPKLFDPKRLGRTWSAFK